MATNLLSSSQAVQLGRVVTVAAGQTLPVLRVTGDDQDAQMLTCALSFEPEVIGSLGTVCQSTLDVVGIIRFGVGGQQNEAQIDALNGAIFSVPASYLEVLVQNNSIPVLPIPPGEETRGPQPRAVVSASVGYGTRGQNGIPTAFRTLEIPLSFGGGTTSGSIRIPRWAAVGIVVYWPANAANVGLSVRDVDRRLMYEKKPIIVGESFPIITSASQLVLEQTGSPSIARAFAQFALVF